MTTGKEICTYDSITIARGQQVLVDMRVRADRDAAEDCDKGRVAQLSDASVLVAWDSGVMTTIPVAECIEVDRGVLYV